MKKQTTIGFQTALVQLPLMVREDPGAPAIKSPSEVLRALPDVAQLAQEAFFVITLNSANKMINKHMITLGIVDSSLVHPREVFRAAILDGAAAIILAHNHPSGETKPSTADLNTTKQLCKAGELLGIRVLDHVIIGHGATPYLSMQEHGLLHWTE